MLPKKRKFTPSEFETFNAQAAREASDDRPGSAENETSEVGIDLSLKPRPEADAFRCQPAHTAFRSYESPAAAAASADVVKEPIL
jgi:hypothetical protein